MLTQPETMVVELVYQDKERNRGQTTFRLPFATEPEVAFSVASYISSAIAAISDALLVSVNLRYSYYDDTTEEAEITSNVGYYWCLYYSNGEDTEPFFIPSPRASLLETEGPFAGVRLNLARSDVVALADALTSALAGTLAPDGLVWDRSLIVGGRTL